MATIIVNGAYGKMGSLAVQTLNKEPDFEVIAELGAHDSLANKLNALKPDVVLDLTTSEAIHRNIQVILDSKIPAVIGTTGLSADEIVSYKRIADAQKQGILLVPNFSISVLLMMKYAHDAAHYFSEVEIVEMHHPEKLDSPSGTARKTARMIAENLQKPLMQTLKPVINTASTSRGGHYDNNTVPIHSIRLSGKLAHQQVIFGSTGETLTIEQNTINRECFMPGLLMACRAVQTLDHFVEGLEMVLWG